MLVLTVLVAGLCLASGAITRNFTTVLKVNLCYLGIVNAV